MKKLWTSLLLLVTLVGVLAVGVSAAEVYVNANDDTAEDTYKTIDAAIDVAGSGGTVQLLSDVTEAVTIANGETIILDLNGYTLKNNDTVQNGTGETRYNTITNAGTLTIKDSVGTGVVDNVSHGKVALENNGTILEISGGKFTRSAENGTSGSNSYYTIRNGGQIDLISGGTFENSGAFSSMLVNGWNNPGPIETGTIKAITGGTFTGGAITIKNDDGGTIGSISGATITNSVGSKAIQNTNSIGTITDTTITATCAIMNASWYDVDDSGSHIEYIGVINEIGTGTEINGYLWAYNWSKCATTIDVAKMYITDGTYNGDIYVNDNGGLIPIVEISGGTHVSDPTSYLASGYKAISWDGNYEVFADTVFVVSFDAGSGSTVDATLTGTDGTLSSVPTSTLSGYTFKGWYQADGTKVTTDTVFTADETVTASWSKNSTNTGTVVTTTTTTTTTTDDDDDAEDVTDETTDAEDVTEETTDVEEETTEVEEETTEAEDTTEVVLTAQESANLEATGYTDVAEDDWHAEAVQYVVENNLFQGTSSNGFSPETPMSREMTWVVLARLNGEEMSGATAYDDAKAWAEEMGITDGSNPSGNISREQLVTLLWRNAGSPEAEGDLSAYGDADAISDYAQAAMAWAIENSVISGMDATTLNPTGEATRAHVAQIMMNLG